MNEADQKFLHENQEFISYAKILADGEGGFRDSMYKVIMSGQMPTGPNLDAVVDTLAKLHGGRRGSKKYKAMYQKLNDLLP